LGEQRQRAPLPPPLLMLALLSGLALIWFGLSIAGYTPLHYDNQGAAVINACWVAFNLALIVAAIVRVRSLQYGTERRSGFRFATNLSGMVASHPCRIQDISMTGTLLSITGARAAEQIGGRIVPPGIDVLHGTVTLEAEECARDADGPNRVITACSSVTTNPGGRTLALALANIWVEEAQAAPRAERPNGPRENRSWSWAGATPAPRLLAPVEIETPARYRVIRGRCEGIPKG
jgi:hypothetical protein